MSSHRPADNRNLDLGPGKEFDIVRILLAEWGRAAQGIGDDAAVLAVPAGERLVVSTDTSVEGVHFSRVFPVSSANKREQEAREIATGIREGASAVLCPIVGGDLSAGKELSLTITALGSAAAAGVPPGRMKDLSFSSSSLKRSQSASSSSTQTS